MLDVGDENQVHWKTYGDPDGKPDLVVHGGPGAGCNPRSCQYFDPDRYKLVLFDNGDVDKASPL